jgi:EAL domain-containing protein (putative c-di-GMP-specific phosphodiesterase class I)/AmiR/NasT family two-component response regulator
MAEERPDRIRVLLAEDDTVVREAMSDLVSGDPSLRLLGAAADADEAILLALAHHPDVMVLDVRMPGGGGPAALRAVKKALPKTRVVALSAYEDRPIVLEMVREGADAYLVKGTPARDILQTIHEVMRGGGALSAEVTAEVLGELGDRLVREEVELDAMASRMERITDVISAGGPRMVFQPIVRLSTGGLVGVEALARFPVDPECGAHEWFQQAREVGLGPQLEIAAARSALAHVSALPSHAYMGLNFSPQALMSKAFEGLLADLPRGRFVVEVTEHARIDDYEALAPVLRDIREFGGRLAVDDAGAGFASLRHILQLAPEVIKIDISLTRCIDTDRARRALTVGLVSFAGEMGMVIVAEGIETRGQLEMLRSLGVEFGQGFFLARPAAPSPRSLVMETRRPSMKPERLINS